jgi:hypothetical protein
VNARDQQFDPEANLRLALRHEIAGLDHAYIYGMQRFDQSQLPATETAIEFVLRKRTPEDIERKGTYPLR